MKKGFGKAKGQIAVLYAGIIAVVIGAVALGADVAVMYVNWEHVQKTADSAAVAVRPFYLQTRPTTAPSPAAVAATMRNKPPAPSP